MVGPRGLGDVSRDNPPDGFRQRDAVDGIYWVSGMSLFAKGIYINTAKITSRDNCVFHIVDE
jgi:hypothetical protein